jgi:hypothetical protein
MRQVMARPESSQRVRHTGHGIGNVKAHNLRAVLLTLLHQGPTSRVHLAQLTGLSTTTITNLIAGLNAYIHLFAPEGYCAGRRYGTAA